MGLVYMGSEEFSFFFSSFLFVFSSLFFVFVFLFLFSSILGFFFAFLLILLGQEQTTAIYWKNGEFHSDPVCTDPVENFPSRHCNATKTRGTATKHAWRACGAVFVLGAVMSCLRRGKVP